MSRGWLLAAAALASAACQKASSEAAPLKLSPVQWNATDGGVGAVQAVAELAENVYVFGDDGAHIFAGGVPLSVDATVTKWRSAAAIPAADGTGTWCVGLDGDGKLWRVRADGVLEPISARYGLAADDVKDVAPLGSAYTAFALGSALAVTDGTTVTRYDAAADSLAGGAGKVAWAEVDTVRRFDPARGALEGWKLPGVRRIAVSSTGRIAAATGRELYYESGTLNLNLVYTAPDGATITALAAAKDRFWFSAGGRVGLLDRGQVHSTDGAPLAGSGGRLFGSPSGDVWAVASGALERWANAAAGDFATWQQTVLPTFSRVCASCHLPTGTAGVDLASYERWKQKRALIYQRVIDRNPSPMPPVGSGVTLSDAELAAIKAWAGGGA